MISLLQEIESAYTRSDYRFALLVIPHFACEDQAEARPFALPNDGAMTWQWLNTVNRVNTQVKKVSRYLPPSAKSIAHGDFSMQTLILCYVTVHSDEMVTPQDLENPVELLSRYSVREVTVRRFVPARMRD